MAGIMDQMSNNFICLPDAANAVSFSFKGKAVVCTDFIALAAVERKQEWFFTLAGRLTVDTFRIAADKLYSCAVSVADVFFHCAKRVLRRAVAGVRHFVCSNQRGVRRVAPMVPMALRL